MPARRVTAASGVPLRSMPRYRGLAATVRAHLLEVQADGGCVRHNDQVAARDAQALRRVLEAGRKYRPTGDLDITGSSSGSINVAVELPRLLRTAHIDLDAEGTGVADWARRATTVLLHFDDATALDQAELEFVDSDLVPVLTAWMRLSAPVIQE